HRFVEPRCGLSRADQLGPSGARLAQSAAGRHLQRRPRLVTHRTRLTISDYSARARVSRPTTAPESAASASPWRCTTFHSPSSRRKIVVTRRTYGLGSAPLIDAVVCSSATVYARSPRASAATISFSYDRQFE